MKIYRPLWVEGVFLSPAQFQQQACWDEYQKTVLARLTYAHPWGVLNVAFDDEALRTQQLKLQEIQLLFADGTLVDSNVSDNLPPAVSLSSLTAEQTEVIVYLALPLLHANGHNYLKEDEQSTQPRRYQQQWLDVQDLLGSEQEQMAVARYALQLRFAHMENSDYQTCAIARLQRDSQGLWRIDSRYIPPLLQLKGQPYLLGRLENLLLKLRVKQQRLMTMRRESNQRMADFVTADVSLFWLLNALNSAEPILAHWLAHPQQHPETLYQELARLAGALLTFSLAHDTKAIPAYQHQQLRDVFFPLIDLIGELLEASLPSRVMAIELSKVNSSQYRAILADSQLRGEMDLYLSVRSSLPLYQLQQQFPSLCKVGAPDDVKEWINMAIQGVPLLALNQVPAALPIRLENQYFALDLTHQAAKNMLAVGECAIYLPSLLADVQLELFAIFRS